jgi:hypothetical protein
MSVLYVLVNTKIPKTHLALSGGWLQSGTRKIHQAEKPVIPAQAGIQSIQQAPHRGTKPNCI